MMIFFRLSWRTDNFVFRPFIILELQPVSERRPPIAINSQRSDPTCYMHPTLLLSSNAIFLWRYIFRNPFFTCPWLWQWRFSISRYTYYYYRYRTTRPRIPREIYAYRLTYQMFEFTTNSVDYYVHTNLTDHHLSWKR